MNPGLGSDRWRAEPGRRLDLATLDPGSTEGAPGGHADTEAALPALHEELADLQDRLWAEAKRSLLVVLQAMDAGGKDGTVSHVFRGVNPQGTRVAAFKQPTNIELEHDFLWRVHQVTPRAGEIAVFNRSHYEDVLVPRVHKLITKARWKARYGHIKSFESLLVDGGTTIVKLFLHISKEEQHKRFDARLGDPTKRWKFQSADLVEREHWDEYQVAYDDAISKTTTDRAPWYVIPANHKWYRNWAVSCILIDTLRGMDPQYPEPTV